MRSGPSRFLAVALLSSTLLIAQSPKTISVSELKAAAAKAVALLQKVGDTWYGKHSCTSCHNHTLPMMAFARARSHGVPVDEDMATLHARRSLAYLTLDRGIQGSWQGNVANEEALALLAAHDNGISAGVTGAAYAKLIAGRQMPDGHWLTDSNRPPQDYSEITTTARALRVLQLHLPPRMNHQRAERVGRARTWLETQDPIGTEGRAFRLFGLAWADANDGAKKRAVDILITSQQSDGGWAQLPGLTTDAYSTGEVLVALHEAAGLPTAHAAYRKGLHYLLGSQQQDGSWHVESQIHHPANVSPPYFDSGFPFGKDQYISAMATSWAAMAISLALPSVAVKYRPGFNGLTDHAEPWAETILFGSPGEVRDLLKSGFDPNSKDAHGTTALMMAIPDLDKVGLLLGAGADVNGKADSRFTPLMVATAYRGTAPIVGLLLERGATIDAGNPPPVFNASATCLAIAVADVETLDLLIARGANISCRMYFFGFFESFAFFTPMAQGHREMVRYLATHGLTQRQLGIALRVSVFSNQPGQVRDLISMGANVNQVDPNGMTPLLYAASVNFGNTEIAEVLLSANADFKARTKDGMTALALAKKYGYRDLQKVLETAGATE